MAFTKSFDKTQRGVVYGMSLAVLTAISVFALASIYISPVWTGGHELSSRIRLASWALLLPSLTLLVCIARLANHRFFTPEDIHGSALTQGTDRAKLLQALLQNTLEQAALAIPTYLATAINAPVVLLPIVPAAACMFLIGRIFFFAGYAKGAPSRAYGFALTFHPTVMLILLLLALAVVGVADI